MLEELEEIIARLTPADRGAFDLAFERLREINNKVRDLEIKLRRKHHESLVRPLHSAHDDRP